jgi:group I intron endonuclease
MLVYQAYNPISNKFYIGKTTKPLYVRRERHLKDAARKSNKSMFHKSIRKHGIEVFDWCVLGFGRSVDELNKLEKYWIDLVKRAGHGIYNMTQGGDGGSVPGKDNPNYGKTIPQSQRDSISQSLKRYYSTHPGTMTGRASPLKGKPISEEVKKRISISHRRIKKTWLVGERNPSARAVVCITTGELFATATSASKYFNCDISSIIKCCRGKKKTVKGMQFAYQVYLVG